MTSFYFSLVAIAFLEMMNLKRTTIKQQLEQLEFQSIQPILVGELKAIDMVISEFTQLFEIHESETMETSNMTEDDNSTIDSEATLANDEEGKDLNESN